MIETKVAGNETAIQLMGLSMSQCVATQLGLRALAIRGQCMQPAECLDGFCHCGAAAVQLQSFADLQLQNAWLDATLEAEGRYRFRTCKQARVVQTSVNRRLKKPHYRLSKAEGLSAADEEMSKIWQLISSLAYA